jgi:hypothetical protein
MMEQLLRRGIFTTFRFGKNLIMERLRDQYFYLESRSLSLIGSKSRQSIFAHLALIMFNFGRMISSGSKEFLNYSHDN